MIKNVVHLKNVNTDFHIAPDVFTDLSILQCRYCGGWQSRIPMTDRQEGLAATFLPLIKACAGDGSGAVGT